MHRQHTRKIFLYVLAVIGLTLLYFVPRLAAIKSFSLFNDEAIYARWAQQGFFNPNLRLISLTDGKQPLYIWLVTTAMHIIPSPLAAGRIVSLFAGFGTMIGLGCAAWLLFARKTTVGLTMLLYALYPFAIMHDRMALYDSLLACLYIWTINVSILFARKPTLGYALLLANILGAALLTKSTALMFFLTIPLAFLLTPLTLKPKKIPEFALYAIIIVLFSFIYQSVLNLSLEAAFVAQKNQTFAYPLSHILTVQGVGTFASNIWMFLGWLLTYLTVPVAFMLIISFVFPTIRHRSTVFLFLCFVLPFVGIAAVAKMVFPRHIMFTTMPLVPIVAYALVTLIQNTRLRLIGLGILMLSVVTLSYTDVRILTDLSHAPIPEIDRYQYVNGPPAGGGVRQIVTYLQNKSADKKITIGAEGTYGSFPKTIMELYFFQSPNVDTFSFDENSVVFPHEATAAATPVYFIFNAIQSIPKWPMEKVIEVQKGIGPYYMRLYRYTGN